MATKQKAPATEVMVVNDTPGEECRIAVLEDNHLEELYAERTSTATNVGNIYKGRVVNVEPAIQAAFIDYGRGANGFLHISDLHPRYFPGDEVKERVGKKIPRRDRPPIQDALKRGREVLVQVLKEGIGTKGPTLTSYLSVPGRLLVMMPDMDRVGVSRKVEDEEKRREMRRVLDSLDLPAGFGFILRTAGFGRTKTELKRDVAYLTRMWKVMEKRIGSVSAPCELYTESDLLIRTVRDVLRPSIDAIVVDSQSAYERVGAFLRVIAPRSAPKVVRYHRATPIFHAFDIERQIELIHSREVPLSSGGRLVIEQTEALVAIDVNSGKSRSASSSEANAFNTNCEAVDEICRQLRLRDLGGLVINDLIDMRLHRHRRQIEERFRNNLKRDRARTTILRISDFGLLEMTRQRMRPSLRKSHFMACPQCEGHGEIKAPESVAADITRQVTFLLDHDRVKRVEIVCSPRVASVLLSRKRRELVHMEDGTGKMVDVRVSDDIALDRVDYYAYDDRNADINVAHLPAGRPPTLGELEAEEARVDEASARTAPEGPEKPAGRRRSRRRRKKGGPADATAIALAGGFDEEVPAADAEKDAAGERAAAAPSKKRSRSRRRRRKPETPAAETSAATVPARAAEESSAKPASRRKRSRRGKKKTAHSTQAAGEVTAEVQAAAGSPIRVHELAKELDVQSREVLAKAPTAVGLDLKSHMSSVSPETADALRDWFTEQSSAEPQESAEDRPATSRRRRRRGGRRRGGRGTAPAASEGESAKSPPAPEGAPGDASKKKKTRRTRGKKRSPTAAADEAPGTPKPAADAKPAAKQDGAQSSSSNRKKAAEAAAARKRTRKKTSTKRSAEAAPEPAKPATNGEAHPARETPKRKKRRTLYRSHKKLSAAAIETETDSDSDSE